MHESLGAPALARGEEAVRALRAVLFAAEADAAHGVLLLLFVFSSVVSLLGPRVGTRSRPVAVVVVVPRFSLGGGARWWHQTRPAALDRLLLLALSSVELLPSRPLPHRPLAEHLGDEHRPARGVTLVSHRRAPRV